MTNFMANFVANSGFDEDFEARANEAGANTQAQTQQSQTTANNSLLGNPYLFPAEASFSRDPLITRDAPVFEAAKTTSYASKGSMEFNNNTISPEHRIGMLMRELKSAYSEEQGQEVSKEREISKVSKVESKVKKQAENLTVKSILAVNKVSKGIFGFLKNVLNAFQGLYDLVSFKTYTPEQKKKMEEDKRKAQEKAAVKKSYFGKISEKAKDLYIQTNRNLVELEDRLGITGLSTELRNKYLGRRRNMSAEERNIHLAHFTALGVREEEAEKEQQQKRVQAAQTQSKDPLDLNKVAEGGSLLSSTGGQ